MKNKILLLSEWHKQDAVILSWPHSKTDWADVLEIVSKCYVTIAIEILKRQSLVIICRNKRTVEYELKEAKENFKNLILVEIDTNDTWVRDYGPITVLKKEHLMAYDFTFNAWGMKFASDLDNQVNRELFHNSFVDTSVSYQNKKNFVLEGGAIESDGKGTLLTTSQCLLSPNRNSHFSKQETENYLKEIFGLDRVLWVDHGYLAGDDTDSHIDTLARFCDEHTIAYVKCDDEKDEHYAELKKMEKQLKGFKDFEGNPYKLLALPMAKPAFNEDNHRLPATYANFLIMNDAILMPFYKDVERDEQAKAVLQEAFPDKEIIGIDCRPLIEQHGSLHCITMQLPQGFLV